MTVVDETKSDEEPHERERNRTQNVKEDDGEHHEYSRCAALGCFARNYNGLLDSTALMLERSGRTDIPQC